MFHFSKPFSKLTQPSNIYLGVLFFVPFLVKLSIIFLTSYVGNGGPSIVCSCRGSLPAVLLAAPPSPETRDCRMIHQ